ncbi:NAD(+)/NADH kinase [Cryptosporangium phraense]|uniref:NAD kinase n=1 Tax=Cryptosporangium phraense TaxID=2593070 RepID=A0A545AGN4_9ACTN|nr:NAD(+)/NADH kinase [Cryptosporangium phraense]TQS39825.1 NAD(+)/NADH kinase [Cryptosporangium phraense]
MHKIAIGLVFHPTKNVLPVASTVVEWAGRHEFGVYVREADRDRAPEGVSALPPEEFVRTCDALVSIGGDGTMLGALRLVADSPRPVLGVNLGKLGFLIEVDPVELPAALDRLSAEDFTVEPHSCLRISVDGKEFVAFNDLAVIRQPGSGVAAASLAVDGQRYGYYRCDSLVLATAAGSTAYNYAAGGPVISPATEALIVTPTAPLAGISRSLVLSAGEPVRLDLLPDSGDVTLEIDGRALAHVGGGGSVDVRLEPRAGLVVRLDSQTHRQRSYVKLSLLDLPLLPEELRELIPASYRARLER